MCIGILVEPLLEKKPPMLKDSHSSIQVDTCPVHKETLLRTVNCGKTLKNHVFILLKTTLTFYDAIVLYYERPFFMFLPSMIFIAKKIIP